MGIAQAKETKGSYVVLVSSSSSLIPRCADKIKQTLQKLQRVLEENVDKELPQKVALLKEEVQANETQIEVLEGAILVLPLICSSQCILDAPYWNASRSATATSILLRPGRLCIHVHMRATVMSPTISNECSHAGIQVAVSLSGASSCPCCPACDPIQ